MFARNIKGEFLNRPTLCIFVFLEFACTLLLSRPFSSTFFPRLFSSLRFQCCRFFPPTVPLTAADANHLAALALFK
uniref:Putative secreted protein n=1 Tax=Anopheles triannulatus TaxID=58253 RepID=A0A2M4B4N2_9DIPT